MIKKITITIEKDNEDVEMIFLDKKKIVKMLGDKKALLSDFFKSLIKP